MFKTFLLWYPIAFVKKITLHKIITTKLQVLFHSFYSSSILKGNDRKGLKPISYITEYLYTLHLLSLFPGYTFSGLTQFLLKQNICTHSTTHCFHLLAAVARLTAGQERHDCRLANSLQTQASDHDEVVLVQQELETCVTQLEGFIHQLDTGLHLNGLCQRVCICNTDPTVHASCNVITLSHTCRHFTQ